MQGFIVAGTHSGCGKTTVALGLMAALREKGFTVKPFKTGPDFIDSGLHRLATGQISRNLDLWMCGEEYVRSCYLTNALAGDVAVVEGVMGLYDGDRSTAHLAEVLNIPVILVVDGYGMAESAGPMVRGFFDWPRYRSGGRPVVKGVIFNRVASAHHYERLRRTVEDVPVLGHLPRDVNFDIPHRHLGLVVAEEDPISTENINRLADTILTHIDIDRILSLAQAKNTAPGPIKEIPPAKTPKNAVRVAVAADRAFSFYYQDNFDLIEKAGGEIVFFSPLSDTHLPDGIDAVYLGGGYPELYAAELSNNEEMRTSIRGWAESGGALYAECGGFMYLTRSIRDFEGNVHSMVGFFPFTTVMKQGRAHLGYREVLLSEAGPLGNSGDIVRGHEFHYSEIEECSVPAAKIYEVKNSAGDVLPTEGYRLERTLGSYVHIHFGSNPMTARRFIEFAQGRI
jgi:cobyrinic acid a,c-diamide synthase